MSCKRSGIYTRRLYCKASGHCLKDCKIGTGWYLLQKEGEKSRNVKYCLQKAMNKDNLQMTHQKLSSNQTYDLSFHVVKLITLNQAKRIKEFGNKICQRINEIINMNLKLIKNELSW